MEYLGADFGIAGEGEGTFREFLVAYEGSKIWETVSGLVWREGEEWRRNPVQRVADLKSLPRPALEYFTPERYQEALGSAKLPGMAPVQTRRGCPMKCIYCTTPLLEGRLFRSWEPKQVASWLADWYEKWGLTRFYFVDNLFNCPPGYAKDLCRAIIDLKLPLEWGALLNPSAPDRELFQLMHRAGGGFMQVGNESGSELVLTKMGKGFGRQQVELTFRLMEEEGIPYSCFLLLGGPGETPETVRESVALLEQYHAHLVNLTVGVRKYEVNVPFGVVTTNGPYVEALEEKPQYSFFVNAGVYLLEPGVVQFVTSGERLDMTDLIARLLAAGERVVSFPIIEYWLDVGSHSDYQRAQQDYQNGVLA